MLLRRCVSVVLSSAILLPSASSAEYLHRNLPAAPHRLVRFSPLLERAGAFLRLNLGARPAFVKETFPAAVPAPAFVGAGSIVAGSEVAGAGSAVAGVDARRRAAASVKFLAASQPNIAARFIEGDWRQYLSLNEALPTESGPGGGNSPQLEPAKERARVWVRMNMGRDEMTKLLSDWRANYDFTLEEQDLPEGRVDGRIFFYFHGTVPLEKFGAYRSAVTALAACGSFERLDARGEAVSERKVHAKIIVSSYRRAAQTLMGRWKPNWQFFTMGVVTLWLQGVTWALLRNASADDMTALSLLAIVNGAIVIPLRFIPALLAEFFPSALMLMAAVHSLAGGGYENFALLAPQAYLAARFMSASRRVWANAPGLQKLPPIDLLERALAFFSLSLPFVGYWVFPRHPEEATMVMLGSFASLWLLNPSPVIPSAVGRFLKRYLKFK